MRRALLLALACLLLLSSCTEGSPAEGEAISASVTEYREPETTVTEAAIPETEETVPEADPETETEPDVTRLEEVLHLLPADVILEVSERLSEFYRSYERKTETVTEIDRDGDVTRSEFCSELLMSDGNASFKRTSEDGDEEYFLIDGFLCYGGQYGSYRFGGYDISSFSELAGNYFSLEAFEGGTVESDGELITLKFDRLTDRGIAQITEMLGLQDGYEIEITRAEFRFVTDTAAHLKEKSLTLEAAVTQDGEEVLSFTLISRTEQSRINEEIDLPLPAMTSYVLISDTDALVLYESALADVASFWQNNQAFELSETDEIEIGGTQSLRLTEKVDYAYARKIGASVERAFTNGKSKLTRVLTHFNHRRGFSQINGGSIFVDSTLNASNLEDTLTEPFGSALLPFSYFGRIASTADGSIEITLNTEGKIALVREALFAAGIYANSISVTSSDEARAYVTLDENGKVTSLGFSISAQVTADGKTYTVSRTRDLKVVKKGSAQVKVIYIDVDDEEEGR